MACSGLHCAGCAGGITVPVVPLAAAFGLAWIAEHIVEVAIVCATSGALAVAAVVALMRWADRRDALRAAAWRQLHTRPVPEVVSATTVLPPPTAATALGFRDLHIHLDGVPDATQVAIIRQALNGRTDQR